MPKVGMRPVRRRQLIDAAIRTIERYGFAETTMTRIARTAGLSTGTIVHYFGDKNSLLAATMRTLLSELQDEIIDGLRNARTPLERIEAVICANFSEKQFTASVCAAWLSFHAQVPHSPELARLHHAYISRLRTNLRHAFSELLPAKPAGRAALVLAAVIDGIWVQAAVTPKMFGSDEARSLTYDYLRMLLAYYDLDNGLSTERDYID